MEQFFGQANFADNKKGQVCQVEANMMNPHPHPISCPQHVFEQSTKELKELSIKLMKNVQDGIA